MKTKVFTLAIFFILFFSGLSIAQPWTYLFDDYEGTDLLYTTTSNVAIGPALKNVDLPYFNMSGVRPNINLISTQQGFGGNITFNGLTDYCRIEHGDGYGLVFHHGTGTFDMNNPSVGLHDDDKSMLSLTPDLVIIGDGSTNTKLQVNGDIDFTGKLYRNGVEFAGLTELLWTKDASNNINYASGKVGIGVPTPGYKLHVAGDIYANGGWLRVSGNQGLYFESHGGGFYMDDDTWIKTFNNKSFYQNTGILRTDGVFQVGSDGSRFHVTQTGNTGIGLTTVPAYKLDVAGDINYTGKLLKNGVEVGLSSLSGAVASISATGSANNFKSGYTFAYATSGTPWNGGLVSFGGFDGRYDCQFSSNYWTGKNISFRTRNGDNGTWNAWNELYHAGNLNKSDVDFAAQNISATGDIHFTGHLYQNGQLYTGDSGWSHILDDYEGTDIIHTATSNVVVGPALKAVDLPYFNFSGGTPNINLINTGGGWESMNFYGNIDFYTMFHSDGVGLQFVHGTGAFNMDDPTQGPYWDKTMLNLTPDVVTVGGANDGSSIGSTNTKLQVNGDIDFTGKLYRNGVELAAFPDVIWTKDASNNVNYMAGKVGIGTTSPDAMLNITNTNQGITTLKAVGKNGSLLVDNVGSGNNYYAASIGHFFQDNSSNYLMSILATGNIGIGTTAPTSKLDVVGDINFTGTLLKNGQPFTGTLWTKDASSNISYAGGAVSIGTTTPATDAKLTVKGKIVAGEVLVKNITEIPDYVFKTDYKLMPLHEVEQFVSTNNHLPDVPSEKEFKENGMNLTTMNTTLLKKVEELTLYLIEQNKSNLDLKKQVETMQKEIELLKKK